MKRNLQERLKKIKKFQGMLCMTCEPSVSFRSAIVVTESIRWDDQGGTVLKKKKKKKKTTAAN